MKMTYAILSLVFSAPAWGQDSRGLTCVSADGATIVRVERIVESSLDQDPVTATASLLVVKAPGVADGERIEVTGVSESSAKDMFYNLAGPGETKALINVGGSKSSSLLWLRGKKSVVACE